MSALASAVSEEEEELPHYLTTEEGLVVEQEPLPLLTTGDITSDSITTDNDDDAVVSDAELIAALQTLGIDDDDIGNDNNNENNQNDDSNNNETNSSLPLLTVGVLDYPSAEEELPELEFTGIDDPLLLQSLDEQLEDYSDNNNLYDVFDDDDDPLLVLPDATAATATTGTSSFEEPTSLDILHQLENLKLHEEAASNDGSPWTPPNFHDPNQENIPVDDDEEAEETIDPLTLLCQPCNDPEAAIPPPPIVAVDEETDQAWLVAVASILAEQYQDELDADRKDDADFWEEQLSRLRLQQQQQQQAGTTTAAGDPAAIASSDYNNSLFDYNTEFDLFPLEGITDDYNNDDKMVPTAKPNDNAAAAVAAGGDATAHSSTIEDQKNDDPPPPEQQVQISSNSRHRREALQAAAPYMDAFGVTTTAADNSSSRTHRQQLTQQQRECYGHKERILGCDFSPCGNYLATASQDSSIRVWSCKDHRQLSVLNGHSTEHECLRVAWASPNWASDQIPRRNKGEYKYLLATGGADGMVHIWGCENPDKDQWTNFSTLDHSTFNHVAKKSLDDSKLEKIVEVNKDDEQDSGKVEPEEEEEVDVPQIYSLQFIDHWEALPNQLSNNDEEAVAGSNSNSFLLTSSDDHIHLWEINEATLNKKIKSEDGEASKQLQLREVLSLWFGPLSGPAYGVAINQVTNEGVLYQGNHPQPKHDNKCPQSYRFGGDRNPDNIIFVFDASYCPVNGLLGVALSDGSLRLMNGRGVCLSVLQLPGCQSHLTSFCWDSTGENLATTVATGHLITWKIDKVAGPTPEDSNYHHSLISEGIRATCCCIMEGGHVPGRPLYGAHYLENDELLISWGSDGRLCLWDSRSDGEIDAPIAILKDNHKEERDSGGYPIFAVSVSDRTTDRLDDSKYMLSIAIAGGGSEGGFLGIPVYLRDVLNLGSHDDLEAPDVSSKKAKTSS